MDRALNAVCMVCYLNKSPAPVQSSPYTGEAAFAVITFTFPVAEGTVILMPSVGTGVDSDVLNSILVRVEVGTLYNGALDIE